MTKLTEAQRDNLSSGAFAFPKERKEPLTDAGHVRNASARFNQVQGVSKEEKEKAKGRIKKAADKFDVDLSKDPD